jgi:hypothetical protein
MADTCSWLFFCSRLFFAQGCFWAIDNAVIMRGFTAAGKRNLLW